MTHSGRNPRIVELSRAVDRLERDINVGYTFASGDVAGTVTASGVASLPDEINYTGGVEFIAGPRVTVTGDVVGRTLRGAGHLEVVSKSFEYIDPTIQGPPGPGCAGFISLVCATAHFDEFNPRSGDLTLLLGTGGVKVNPFGNCLISASVLFPLSNNGCEAA